MRLARMIVVVIDTVDHFAVTMRCNRDQAIVDILDIATGFLLDSKKGSNKMISFRSRRLLQQQLVPHILALSLIGCRLHVQEYSLRY